MSSEGPKMVERSYGWPEVAGKVKNSPVITMVAAAASPARSGSVRRRLAVKFGWLDRPEVAHLPV